jgi:hypothetical protein
MNNNKRTGVAGRIDATLLFLDQSSRRMKRIGI